MESQHYYTPLRKTIGTYTTLAEFLGDNTYITSYNMNNMNIGARVDIIPINYEVPVKSNLNMNNTVHLSVYNNGDVNVGEFSVKLYDGYNQIGKQVIYGGLGTGASTIRNFTWKPTTTGIHNLKVIK